MHDDDNDALIDAWHEGYFSRRSGKSLPYDPGSLADAWHEGRRQAARDARVEAVMPERPEGYYHQPLDPPEYG